jgi:hypothetical protein
MNPNASLLLPPTRDNAAVAGKEPRW